MKVLELHTKTMFDAEVVLPTWYGREDIDFQVIRVKNWKTCSDRFVYDWFVLWVDKRLVEPLRPLIDCEPYWGNGPKFEDEKHLGYMMRGIAAEKAADVPELVKELERFWIPQAQRCLGFLQRAAQANTGAGDQKKA